ncbi:hypothetical protein J5N97_011892 [Dioscorea zingiberensis]|uniref:DUF4220 domain-containing protein n=1 Tax=Dioscorea zingiberensis TaxID=325984 RepID=A0A9D5D3J4_9LILI|nr:hypothetical protein J5N97_011892 [Dioscorea zingiberensis]
MELFPFRLRRIWNAWDVRAFILTSLNLQIILIFSGSLRKRNSSRWVSLLLWPAYLLADWVATYALGILSNTKGDPDCGSPSASHNENDDLLAFWSPFLLLHLGGPDTITAFSLEDNELWMRHLLGLVFQVAVALYVFLRSLPGTRLKAPALLMFLAGILKYGERSWSLMRASMDCLRNSMVTPPDPGPNYAKFMEEYVSKSAAGLHAEIEVEKESESKARAALDTVVEEITNVTVLLKAHYFFMTFRRLIVDLILTYHNRNQSQSFFLKRSPAQAFKLIEFELSFIYEELFTKANTLHTVAGPFLRFLTFSSILTSLLLFLFTKKHGYAAVDVTITYILLGGALALESHAVGLLVFSEWTFLQLRKHKRYRLSSMIFKSISYFRPPNKPRWSDSMAQYSLISFCLADQPSPLKTTLEFISMKDTWDKYRHTKYIPVTSELKELIFEELKGKASSAEDSKSYKRFSAYRGEWALQKKGYRRELGWSVEVELDESILLWHVATDLCYYSDESKLSSEPEQGMVSNRGMSKALSEYMLYLLLVRPFMLTAGIGQIRYGDTCAEAKIFFQRGHEKVLDEMQACKMLLWVETKVPPVQVKGDRSKSVLFDACILAKTLLGLTVEKRWKITSAVWVEILCYAASHCRSYFHAKQLSTGGELLTLVWFLMAHLGIGEQYRIEAGHARAKLIVEK